MYILRIFINTPMEMEKIARNTLKVMIGNQLDRALKFNYTQRQAFWL
jgi:hypothetical protein